MPLRLAALLLAGLFGLSTVAAQGRQGPPPRAIKPTPARSAPALPSGRELRRESPSTVLDEAGEADQPMRSRPRWQSFLPGMVR